MFQPNFEEIPNSDGLNAHDAPHEDLHGERVDPNQELSVSSERMWMTDGRNDKEHREEKFKFGSNRRICAEIFVVRGQDGATAFGLSKEHAIARLERGEKEKPEIYKTIEDDYNHWKGSKGGHVEELGTGNGGVRARISSLLGGKNN